MKGLLKLVVSIVIGISFTCAHAQGNLQFSQVKLVTTQETVPAGKVWKVESALSGEERYPTSGSTLPSNSRFILVNGSSVCVHEEHVATTGVGFNGCCGGGFWMNNVGMAVNSTTPVLVQVTAQPTKLPLWLPSGSTLSIGTKVSSISVVEFNIIP
jgi:hypothetical protein